MARVQTNLDMDALRTFVTGVDLGAYARAAARLGRSPSAVSLHLRKLEDQVGQPLLAKRGRGLVPTEAGEALLGHARRILDLNDAAVAALRADPLRGEVRLGLPQDFAETEFPEILARFARHHPDVRIEARVERNAALARDLDAGDLDLALLWQGDGADGSAIAELPMVWIGPRADLVRAPDQPLPIVAFDAPCLFRHAGLSALDGAGIPWRIAFRSPSLSGLWAAVAAGLGVTVRTGHGLPPSLAALDPAAAGLPALPRLLVTVRVRAGERPEVARLADMIRARFADALG